MRDYIPTAKYKDLHRSSHYNDLSYLIGEPLALIKGPKFEKDPDGKVQIIADYPNTVLLEYEFVKSEYYKNMPPRKYKILVPKASMLIGDVKLRRICTGEFLVGDLIADLISWKEVIVKE